jgi:toxin ParE1/3/4
MTITWAPEAKRQVRDIWHYIALDDPQAADRMVARLVAVVEKLKHFPHLGRLGREHSRELAVTGTAFIVVYRVEAEEVRIGTVLHGAQRDAE